MLVILYKSHDLIQISRKAEFSSPMQQEFYGNHGQKCILRGKIDQLSCYKAKWDNICHIENSQDMSFTTFFQSAWQSCSIFFKKFHPHKYFNLYSIYFKMSHPSNFDIYL